MDIIEILAPFGFIYGIVRLVYGLRSRLSDALGKSKIGKWIMSPIMVPYVIYLLIKLVRDKDFLMLIENINKQKKITDYF